MQTVGNVSFKIFLIYFLSRAHLSTVLLTSLDVDPIDSYNNDDYDNNCQKDSIRNNYSDRVKSQKAHPTIFFLSLNVQEINEHQ